MSAWLQFKNALWEWQQSRRIYFMLLLLLTTLHLSMWFGGVAPFLPSLEVGQCTVYSIDSVFCCKAVNINTTDVLDTEQASCSPIECSLRSTGQVDYLPVSIGLNISMSIKDVSFMYQHVVALDNTTLPIMYEHAVMELLYNQTQLVQDHVGYTSYCYYDAKSPQQTVMLDSQFTAPLVHRAIVVFLFICTLALIFLAVYLCTEVCDHFAIAYYHDLFFPRTPHPLVQTTTLPTHTLFRQPWYFIFRPRNRIQFRYYMTDVASAVMFGIVGPLLFFIPFIVSAVLPRFIRDLLIALSFSFFIVGTAGLGIRLVRFLARLVSGHTSQTMAKRLGSLPAETQDPDVNRQLDLVIHQANAHMCDAIPIYLAVLSYILAVGLPLFGLFSTTFLPRKSIVPMSSAAIQTVCFIVAPVTGCFIFVMGLVIQKRLKRTVATPPAAPLILHRAVVQEPQPQ